MVFDTLRDTVIPLEWFFGRKSIYVHPTTQEDLKRVLFHIFTRDLHPVFRQQEALLFLKDMAESHSLEGLRPFQDYLLEKFPDLGMSQLAQITLLAGALVQIRAYADNKMEIKQGNRAVFSITLLNSAWRGINLLRNP